MPSTDSKNVTIPDDKTTSPDVKASDTPLTDKLTVQQLAQLFHHQIGSPYGSVEEWLTRSADTLSWE